MKDMKQLCKLLHIFIMDVFEMFTIGKYCDSLTDLTTISVMTTIICEQTDEFVTSQMVFVMITVVVLFRLFSHTFCTHNRGGG